MVLASCCRALALVCAHEWNIDQMLREEPHLEFVRADHVAYQKIVGAVVATFGSLTGHGTGFLQDDLVCFQQAR